MQRPVPSQNLELLRCLQSKVDLELPFVWSDVHNVAKTISQGESNAFRRDNDEFHQTHFCSALDAFTHEEIRETHLCRHLYTILGDTHNILKCRNILLVEILDRDDVIHNIGTSRRKLEVISRDFAHEV